MLWKYHSSENIDYIVDRGFLCYFRFICDLISYMDGSTPGKRSDDEFDILNLYFSMDGEDESDGSKIKSEFIECTEDFQELYTMVNLDEDKNSKSGEIVESYYNMDNLKNETSSPVIKNTYNSYNCNIASEKNIIDVTKKQKRLAYIGRNIDFLESAFDAWRFIKTKEESLSFFSSYIGNNTNYIRNNRDNFDAAPDESAKYGENTEDIIGYNEELEKEHCNGYEPHKIKISKNSNIDIFEDCLTNYADVFGNRKRKFELRKIVLLFSFLVYLLNRDKVSDRDFRERLRIINNLINNSGPEINERENRMTKILSQTKSIVLYGFEKEIEPVGFNSVQMEEEKEKYTWRRKNPNLIEDLNRIEDHHLLHGQIGIIGLDHPEYFRRFETLFSCDLDLVDCALMATGFYPKDENYWRSQFGSSKIESAWDNLFHGNIAENTKEIIRSLLSKVYYGQNYKTGLEINSETQETLCTKNQDIHSRICDNFKFTDEILKGIADSYIKECEDSNFYDFRYYYIKYPSFRPGRYGKYYRFCYGYSVIWAQHRISENSYNPFLKEIFESDDFKEYIRENSLKVELFKDYMLVNNLKIEISEDGYIFKDFESDKEVAKIDIEKNSITRDDFSLQNIEKADREDRIVIFNLKKDEIFRKLNIFKI